MAEDKTPREWLTFLDMRLGIRKPLVQKYEDYYNGDHPLSYATSKFREAFGVLFAAFADNLMQLVVDVPRDRLSVTGFDMGNDALTKQAWTLWQDGGLKTLAKSAHTEAIKCGTSYMLVEPSGLVTVEHPLMCYVETSAANPRDRLAGIKEWYDEVDGFVYANVYLPDAVYKFRRPSTKATGSDNTNRASVVGLRSADAGTGDGWEPKPGDAVVRHKFGVVPLIPFENNPSLLTGGRSDLEVAIPLQNAVNKECADLLVASEYQAYQQRLLTGVEVPRYPEGHEKQGEPIDGADLVASISRVWFAENPDAKAYSLDGTDLKNYVQVIEMFVQHVATKTQIPPQYFLASGSTMANIAAEAMAVIESGFVSKVEDKQETFGPSHAEVMRLRLLADGGPDVRGKVAWRPVTPPPLAQLADAMVKYDSVGVPREWIWRQIGATPEEAIEWRKLLDKRVQDAQVRADRLARAGQPADGPTPGLVMPGGMTAQ